MNASTTSPASVPDPEDVAAPSPLELLRSKSYAVLLALAAIVGAPVALVAFFFPKLVGELQKYLYQTLPDKLGFGHEPLWWPLPLLILAGLITALTIRHLPGTGGHKPAEGLKVAGSPRPIELPGAVLAALATLSFGAVLGTGSPAHLHRRRPRSPGHAAAEARRPSAGAGRHRRGRQLRGRRHAGRQPPRRRIPTARGRRREHGRCTPQPSAAARPARGRHRHARLRRPRQLDGVRDVLARDSATSRRSLRRRRPSSPGRSRSASPQRRSER